MFVRVCGHICLPVMFALLALLAVPSLKAANDAFSDLPPGHWAYRAVSDLVSRGVLDGYPDGTFRGKNLVTRYALAVTLARLLQQIESGGGTASLSGGDLATLEKLVREFSDELAMLGVKTASIEERLRGQGREIDELKLRMDRVEEKRKKKDDDRRIYLDNGEIRIVGYNKERLTNFANTILNMRFEVEKKVSGKVGLQYNNSFDQNLGNDVFDTYEAYADFLTLKPFDKLRVGKYNVFLGAGQTLFDRREGFLLETERNDIFFQLGYFDAQLYHVQTSLLGDAKVGFYFIREDSTNGMAPTHTGLYARGRTSDSLQYEFELVDYDRDGVSAADATQASNMNDNTRALMMNVKWQKPGGNQAFRLAYIDQQEDYRSLAVDSDLRYHSKRYTVLEDVLQAVRDNTPSWVDPDEINGFRDIKLGVDFEIPDTPWKGRFDWDMLRDNTSRLNNADDEFDLVTLAFERDIGKDSTFQLRLQSLMFDNENSSATVDTMPSLRRSDSSTVRAQFFVRF